MRPFRLNPGLTWLWMLRGFVAGLVLGRLFSLRALARRLLESRSGLQATHRLAAVSQGGAVRYYRPTQGEQAVAAPPWLPPGWNPSTLALTTTGNNPAPN